ncbi:partial Inner membrane protein YjdF, partial [Rhodocyclaceae bacterium]
MPNEARLPGLLGAVVLVALIVSGLHPHDRPTWLLETLPAMIALAVLVASFRRFPLTPLLYLLIALHALVLIYGGAYTYALTPFGDWLRETFGLMRNP